MDIEGFLADARDKLIKHPTLVALFPLFGEISAAFRRLITHITREYYSARTVNSFICSAMSPSQGGIMTSLSAFKSSLNVSSCTSPKCSKDCLKQSLLGHFTSDAM